MASIYIHIPFCASRCIYCDFFSTTSLEKRERYVDALLTEIIQRKSELHNGNGNKLIINSIYIGGGTPSQLSINQLFRIYDTIYRHYPVSSDAELTIECNPEDVNKEYARGLQGLPINRVSIGIQTFNNDRLLFLHRRHNSDKAIEVVKLIKSIGINNISIDLMFGFPNENDADWNSDITTAIQLDVPHISAYSLMYEDGTRLTQLKEAGEIKTTDDEQMESMYFQLLNRLEKQGYIHYEISNFCKPGYASRHNMGYWNGTSYIGFGAGAHSYDGTHRRWNVSSLEKYINRVKDGQTYFDFETLSENDKYNEFIMTRLRTRLGISNTELKEKFATNMIDFLKIANKHIKLNNMILSDGHYRLSKQGLFISDSVLSDFFIV